MNVELTTDEREFLSAVLRERLGDLKGQIHHATISTFSERLRAEECLVIDLIDRLSAPEMAASSIGESL
jgi:hypothetical protein